MSDSLKSYPQFMQQSDRSTSITPVKLVSNLDPDTFTKQPKTLDKKLTSDITNVKDTFESFRKSTEDVKTKINKLDNISYRNKELTNAVFAALSPFVPARRVSSVPDNIADGNYPRAAGLIALAVVNLPEDTRDLKSAAKQILKGELPKYDYKNCQTQFSFFRGTALESLVNKMGKAGVFLHKWDIPLLETKFGQFLTKILNIDINPFNAEITGRSVPQVMINDSGKSIIRKVEVLAYRVEGKSLAKLVGKALLRIPVISFGILGLLEVPNIINKINRAHGTRNKAKEGSKQTLKSAINVVSIQAGISLIGALLAKKGPAFSLLGMGIGSVIGAYTSKSIQKGIDNLTDKK